MQTVKSLEDLFIHYIQHLYAAEKQIAEAMPAIIAKAQHQSLKNALQHHCTISKKHSARLNKIVALLNENRPNATEEQEIALQENVTSSGITGLIDEVNALLQLHINKHVHDAALIGAVQKIEHYEICSYGTALAYATQLGLHKAAGLLHKTLDEEYDTDDLLTALAMAALNKEGIPDGWEAANMQSITDSTTGTGGVPDNTHTGASVTERTIHNPGGRAGISHRRYPGGESRGH